LELTRNRKAVGAAAAVLAGSVALAFGLPAFAEEPATIDLDAPIAPTAAEDFAVQGCAEIPSGTADWLDAWVFRLPESVPAEGNFVYVEATFMDEDGNVLRYDTEEHGGIVAGGSDDKAYITAPADLELIDAEAQVDLEPDGKDGASRFDLARTCPATAAEPEAAPGS
jgi:hypothetical protein